MVLFLLHFLFFHFIIRDVSFPFFSPIHCSTRINSMEFLWAGLVD